MMDQVRGKKLDPRSLASFLTLLWRWRSGVVGTKSPRKPSSWAIKRLFDQCDKQRIVASVKMSAAGLQQEGALRFAHYILGTKLPNDRDDFFRRLLTGAELGAQNPILHLRTRLAKSERYERKLGRDEVIALVFKAWNFLRLGKRVSLLAWKHEEEFPMPVDTGVQIQQGHDLRAGDATKVATEPAFYRQSGQLGRRAAIANKNGSAPKADISEKSRTKAEA